MCRALCFCLLLPGFSSFSADDTPKIEFSGFARLVAGYLDTDEASFEGYENEVSLSEKSLFGFQVDYTLIPELSISAQLLAHSDEARDSGVEWLYLHYRPSPQWQFKAGRLRTPYLKYSDVIDVGFTYPWLSAPQQLYGSYLFFSRYDGINARYRFNFEKVYVDTELFYGGFDDEITASGESFEIDVKHLYGGAVQVTYGGLQFRAATLASKNMQAKIDGVELLIGALDQAGYDELVDFFSLEGSADSYVIGLTYDSLDWFFSAERMNVSTDTAVLSGIDNYYLTVGRHWRNFQFLITFSCSKQILDKPNNIIPLGVEPQLDALYYGVETFASRYPTDDLNTITLSGRWDWSPSLAFKGEVSFLNGERGKTSFFDINDDAVDFDRNAILYQLGVEWVF
ncbi:hypothetical protein KO501_15505 [Alteromonas sp. C1M14]|nr:hypothetical protein [Alteromonas sp. C1M14]